MANSPGRNERNGISLLDLAEIFPNEEAAVAWFESLYWPDGDPICNRCGSENAYRVRSGKPMPYRCRDCRRYFSLKTNTAMESSKIPLRKWAYAIYLELTNLKGVSSMKLHRDLDMAQSSAWFMKHRIREGFSVENRRVFHENVEVDETYVGGKNRNRHRSKRSKGRGVAGKAPVIGMKCRGTRAVAAQVLERTDRPSVHGFIIRHFRFGGRLFTDQHPSYHGLPRHESVNHGAGEYVRGDVHTQGIDSFWSMLKRGIIGVYHHVSRKHLQRYVNEFVARHNVRDLDTVDQMKRVILGMIGRRLRYHDLVS